MSAEVVSSIFPSAKREVILEYEERFARALAARVVDKPAVSIWMVLLPVLLLHYFHRRQTFETGCEVFARHFLEPRKSALALALGERVEVATGETAVQGASPIALAQERQVEVLAAHYRRLLEAEGDSYRGLVLAAYDDPTRYRAYLTALEESHDAIHAAVLASSAIGEDIAAATAKFGVKLRELHGEELLSLFSSRVG